MIDFPSLKTLTIGNESFKQATSFTMNTLPSLESIEIGNNCFKDVTNKVLFNAFPELITLEIGNSSFYNELNDNMIYQIFQVFNDPKLVSIEIGEYSFSKFGEFSVSYLSSLKSLIIGSIENESNNFINATSIFIKSNTNLILFSNILDLDNLEQLIIGCGSFNGNSSLTLQSILNQILFWIYRFPEFEYIIDWRRNIQWNHLILYKK